MRRRGIDLPTLTPKAKATQRLPRPTTEAELRAAVADLTGAVIPDLQVCHHHTTPWRAFADAYFARYPVTVWKGSRGFGGKSYLLALLGYMEAVTLTASVNILGGSGTQSSNVHRYMSDHWKHRGAPRYLLAGEPLTTETRFVAGNKITALTASQRSVRGPHPQRLRLDEADEMALPILDSAMGQTMSKKRGRHTIKKQTVISSTHQYADGTMTEILKRAAARQWPVYEWCYRETVAPHGWLDPDEVESKRNEVTEVMWDSEYELQEPSNDDRAIDTAAVIAMFDRRLGSFADTPRQYIEIEPPRQGGIYVHGADWARKKDWTVIITLRIDVRPFRLVAYERLQRLPWPVMVKRLDERIDRYGGGGAHDGTGIGDVVGGYLKHSVEPVIMGGRARADLLSEYINGIENGEIESPYIATAEKEHRLATVAAVYTDQDHLPDTIAAGALAYYKAKHNVDPSGLEELGRVEVESPWGE